VGRPGSRSSPISDPGATFFPQPPHGGTERKKKEPKKKERGGLWKLPQPWKSTKDAFGDIYLMISTAARKSLQAFSQFPQARQRSTNHQEF
jgi:hypothetical protein